MGPDPRREDDLRGERVARVLPDSDGVDLRRGVVARPRPVRLYGLDHRHVRSSERTTCVVIRRVLELLPRSNASLETSGSTRLSGIGIAVAFLSRLAPVLSLMDSAGTVLAVAGGCRAVEAARDTLPHPVHVAFVTVAHGRLEAPMERIGCLLLWACGPTVCCRDRPARLRGLGTRRRRGWPSAALLQDRCVRGAVRSPRGGCLRSARPRGQRGTGMASRRCAGRVSPVRACADVAAPEAAVAPGTLRVTWHLPRLHAPEPRTGAPVQASVRRFSGAARTGGSNVAAPVGAGR